MNQHCILIAGAGGIGQAVGLLLAEHAPFDATYFIGDINFEAAQRAADWISQGNTRHVTVFPFPFNPAQLDPDSELVFQVADIVLDCLPGSVAPQVAKLAKDHNAHYVNLTEYVAETEQIKALAAKANTAFILQTGLAPGSVNVLAMDLYRKFCQQYGEQRVEYVGMKVGALGRTAQAPHYYNFTWSPIGVATEYCQDAIVLRNFVKANIPALSHTQPIFIGDQSFEEDFTSGGAADLPEALTGRVRNLDYQTLRYPGHYAWVRQILSSLPPGEQAIHHLDKAMRTVVPTVDEDRVVVYVVVQGYDGQNVLRSVEKSYCIGPAQVGRHRLRAIQVTTAAPMAQCAQLLLTSHGKGVILQSQLHPGWFLGGDFIRRFYPERQPVTHGQLAEADGAFSDLSQPPLSFA